MKDFVNKSRSGAQVSLDGIKTDEWKIIAVVAFKYHGISIEKDVVNLADSQYASNKYICTAD